MFLKGGSLNKKMVRTVEWKVGLNGGDKIIWTENLSKGFNPEEIESHLILIGMLENLKKYHLDRLQKLFSRTVKKDGVELEGSEGEEDGR